MGVLQDNGLTHLVSKIKSWFSDQFSEITDKEVDDIADYVDTTYIQDIAGTIERLEKKVDILSAREWKEIDITDKLLTKTWGSFTITQALMYVKGYKCRYTFVISGSSIGAFSTAVQASLLPDEYCPLESIPFASEFVAGALTSFGRASFSGIRGYNTTTSSLGIGTAVGESKYLLDDYVVTDESLEQLKELFDFTKPLARMVSVSVPMTQSSTYSTYNGKVPTQDGYKAVGFIGHENQNNNSYEYRAYVSVGDQTMNIATNGTNNTLTMRILYLQEKLVDSLYLPSIS